MKWPVCSTVSTQTLFCSSFASLTVATPTSHNRLSWRNQFIQVAPFPLTVLNTFASQGKEVRFVNRRSHSSIQDEGSRETIDSPSEVQRPTTYQDLQELRQVKLHLQQAMPAICRIILNQTKIHRLHIGLLDTCAHFLW